MPTATVTSKGQVTLPKPVRDALGLRAGDRVQFFVRDDGVVELTPRTRDLLSLAGLLTPPGVTVSVEDMDDAIAAAVVAEHERSVG